MMELEVVEIRSVADDVVTLRLAHPHRAELPSWKPGAHIRCTLPSGHVRPFSLCGECSDRTAYTIAVMLNRAGRGASRHVHETDIQGATVLVKGPFNSFRLKPAQGYLFVAGGIGIAPLLPMARTVSRRGLPWELVYVGASRAVMPFLDELTTLPGGRCHAAPEDESEEPDFRKILEALPPGHQIYCCGPRKLFGRVRRLGRAVGAGTIRGESCTYSSSTPHHTDHAGPLGRARSAAGC